MAAPFAPIGTPKSDQLARLCYHCHEVCPDDRLQVADKFFCCNGCKMVYEILSENQLCTFYELDENAGRSLKNQRNVQAYAYLDDPEVQDKLLEFSQETLAQVTLYLPYLHCASCIWLLENLGKLDEGITHARVNFLKKTNTIQFDPRRTSLRRIAALLTTLGYEPEINLNDVEGARPKPISKRLALQIGVAGFAFGNVMLFSFPEYVGMDAETYRWFANIFGYLSLALALPVLLFSARDYFTSAWQGLRQGRLNIDVPLCLALGALFGRSVWEILAHTGAGYLDSFAGLTFLLLIGKWFQQRTWNELSFERDYKSYFPVAATVKRGAEELSVPVQRLEPGDIIAVRNQEIVPADGILLKGAALMDYSFVTGEADPVRVESGDRIFAGGRQLGASIELSLTKRVAQSHLTRLWNNDAFARRKQADSAGKISGLADEAGRFFSWLILTVGGGAFVYWYAYRGDLHTAINAFTAVMIVACPCTLALSIPFTLGHLTRLFGRHRLYLRNSQVIESLAACNAVVFDKTGTITQTSAQQLPFRGGSELSFAEKIAVRSLVRQSSHPLSRQLYASLSEVPTEAVQDFEEVTGAGLRGTVHGLRVVLGSAAFVGAVGQGESGMYVQINGSLRGHFAVQNGYRNGLMRVLDFLRTQWQRTGVPTFLLSGDQQRAAASVAPFFPEADTAFFQQSPQEKLAFIQKLQRQGRKVLMLGDGLNDAGALQQSDAGIVIAEDTNNFTPACDAILHAEAFDHLPQFLLTARAGVRTVWYSYGVALAYNAVGLSYAVTGALSPLVAAILMPLSSVSIVLFGMGMADRAAKKLLGKV